MQRRKLEVNASRNQKAERPCTIMRLLCGFHAPNMHRLMHRICIIVGISHIWKSWPS